MPILFLAAALATASPAAPPPRALVRYASLALDPQATRIASIESRHVEGQASAGHGALVIRDTAGQSIARFDPCEICRYDGLAWSPDGSRLAFVASGGGSASLYLYDGAGVHKLVGVAGLAANPRWSPDGRSIAFLVTESARKESGATQPGVRQVGLIGSDDDARRIALVPLSGGPYRLVSPPRIFIYEYDWLPDGQGFVGTAAEGNGDNQWWVASLRSFALGGGMRMIAAPATQINFPRVSPDGRSVAFIGGLMSDFGSVGGDVFIVPLVGGGPQGVSAGGGPQGVSVGGGPQGVSAGGVPRNLTPGYKATFTSLTWRGPRLLVSAIVGGSEAVGTIEPGNAANPAKVALAAPLPESIVAGDAAFALDRSGTRAAYVTEGFAEAPAIAFGAFGEGRRITHDNDALVAGVRARDVRWRRDGQDVQGWLLEPLGGATEGKQPMITIVHGGPAAATTPRFGWSSTLSDLLRHGYWLFQPNPRGSYGQGAEFVRANVKDFGGGDLEDILAGIDAVEKQAPIDDQRLGLFGHSYGGFMTMWTVTHSQRFKAAVAGAGIADWVAYYGQNGIDQWMIPYFGASAYDDPKVYDRLSPIRTIRQAKTPTFLYVGERDVECPPAQSLEYWHGLKAMGVPTELMIYADEGHGIREPKNIADLRTRMLGWFDKYLGR